MKEYYSKKENLDKVIIGKNAKRASNGLPELPYKNHDEQIAYMALKKIKLHIRNKRKCIKSKKKNSLKAVKSLPEYIQYKEELKLENKKRADEYNKKIWTNEQFKEKVSSVHRLRWRKRKEMGLNWSTSAKESFAIGKFKRSNNIIALYLIDRGIKEFKSNGLQKKIAKLKGDYKDEPNRLLQIDNIINYIKSNYNIIINRDEFVIVVYKQINNVSA